MPPEADPALRPLVESAGIDPTFSAQVGKSGAALQRMELPDGRRVVVKRSSPENDILMAALGETVSPEYLAWSHGLLDRLPAGVAHPIIGGWIDGSTTVVVTRDLGESVLTWDDVIDRGTCRRLVGAVARLHRARVEVRSAGLTPLEAHLTLFTPSRMAPFAAKGNHLAAAALRGWELFPSLVEDSVARAVAALLVDVGPLAAALAIRPVSLLHGDLATVNMAPRDDGLTLIDWAMVGHGPGALDVARFVAGCSQVLEATREEVIADYAEAMAAAYDETAMRLALLAGLVWLGWNKALDATEHPDPAKRRREREDLDWWVEQARVTLDAGLVTGHPGG